MSTFDSRTTETGARNLRRLNVDRKSVIVLVALAVAAIIFLLVRDPVGAANATRAGWELLIGAVATVVNSVTTFIQHLMR